MAKPQEPQHVRVALYGGERAVYMFCNANHILTDDAMMTLGRNAEAISADFVGGVRIIFQELPDPNAIKEFTYIASLTREVDDTEVEALLPALLGGKNFGQRWLMSDHELLPRQRRLVRAHRSGALGDDPTV